jgi:SAM-dependent methyltransferase
VPITSGWLENFPIENGLRLISEARAFAHDELKYDEQYGSDSLKYDKQAEGNGNGLVALLQRCSADFQGPALEIGCGTGLLSVGLVNGKSFPSVILTDPSPQFLNLTRKKLQNYKADLGSVHFAVLLAEELNRLPEGIFSLLALRSVLHHVLDVDGFFRSATRVLRPRGVLAFQEPCREGYILMGAMAQFIPLVIEKARTRLSKEQLHKVQLFIDTMRFYARRDVDKTAGEDKHLFRVDEIIQLGASCGLSVEFFANKAFSDFAPNEIPSPSDPHLFSNFFFDYLRYCMSFDTKLVELIDNHFRLYCQFVEDVSMGGHAPHLHGVFLCQKL